MTMSTALAWKVTAHFYWHMNVWWTSVVDSVWYLMTSHVYRYPGMLLILFKAIKIIDNIYVCNTSISSGKSKPFTARVCCTPLIHINMKTKKEYVMNVCTLSIMKLWRENAHTHMYMHTIYHTHIQTLTNIHIHRVHCGYWEPSMWGIMYQTSKQCVTAEARCTCNITIKHNSISPEMTSSWNFPESVLHIHTCSNVSLPTGGGERRVVCKHSF